MQAVESAPVSGALFDAEARGDRARWALCHAIASDIVAKS